MKTAVIDSIRMASVQDIYPDLARIGGHDIAQENADLDAMDTLMDSLRLDDDTQEQIREQAIAILSSGDENGFRRGFRLAARLALECAAGPEAG